MMHPSAHNTPNDFTGDVCTFGKLCIFLASLLIPGSCIVAICEESIVISYGILTVISFDIITGDIVGLACFARCKLTP